MTMATFCELIDLPATANDIASVAWLSVAQPIHLSGPPAPTRLYISFRDVDADERDTQLLDLYLNDDATRRLIAALTNSLARNFEAAR